MVGELNGTCMDIGSALGEASDAGEDFISASGPDEWLGSGVVSFDEGSDGSFQFCDAAVGASADLLVGQLGEPPYSD